VWAKILYFAAMQNSIWQKAVFLDRDGVLNEDPGDYTFRIEEFKILNGVFETLKTWKDDGFALIVFTNQAGIAKLLYNFNDVEAVHQYFQGQCILHGFTINDFYFCPHHEVASGKCLCRKPASLMFEKALHKYKLDPANCVMIGDKQRDLDAATAVGVRSVLVPTNQGLHPELIL
jgi:D-glycero-D-manno-heptose 1,7-bisphosphate phosphatase